MIDRRGIGIFSQRGNRTRTMEATRAIACALLAMIVAACASTSPSPSPSAHAAPRAASFEEFADGLCSAFDSMFTAVGNPDTGGGSDLSNQLEAAAETGDLTTAETLARQITTELEAGRRFAAHAGGWTPGAQAAGHMDRFLVAYEAWTMAHVERARLGPGAADPQQAFEQAGGLTAWEGMFRAIQAMAAERPPVAPHPCPTVPVTL
jgi:hypothetical protein